MSPRAPQTSTLLDRPSLLARAREVIDEAVPSALRGTPEPYRRARLTILFACVLLTQVPVFAGTYAALDKPLIAAVVAAGGVLLTFTPRVIGRFPAAGAPYVISTLLVVLLIIIGNMRGLYAPGLWWTLLLPIMGMMTGGKRAGLVWLGVVLALTGALTGAELSGYPWPHLLTDTQTHVVTAVSAAMLALVLFTMAWGNETTRAEMVAAVDRANRDMALVLDNVGQGFVTVEPDGEVTGQRSAIAERWFSAPLPGEHFGDWLGRTDARVGVWLKLAWEQVFEDVLPLEAALAALPGELTRGDECFRLEYRPILGTSGVPERMVVIVSDATEHRRVERDEAAQRETLALFHAYQRDHAGVAQFIGEGSALLTRLRAGAPHGERLLHTLKGNASLFGLRRVAERCQELESVARDENREPTCAEVDHIAAAWDDAIARFRPLREESDDHVDLLTHDLADLEAMLERRAPHAEIAAVLGAFRLEPTRRIFERMAAQAQALVAQLGRSPVEVQIEDHGLRLEPARWSPLWSAMAHALRNAVDHGIETLAERQASGKPIPARLDLRSRLVGGMVLVEVIDDGRGIDWARVAERAHLIGLRGDTREDLSAAIFADGLSTRDEVTEVSGRGVGMSALRDACAELGGTVTVESEPGHGTRVTLEIPLVAADRLAA